MLILREIVHRIGIVEQLTGAIRDERHQSYVRHDVKTLLTQRILQIACGYEDADDSDDLRTDPGFKAACDRLPSGEDLASQPTMSRFENTLSSKDIHRITGVLIQQFMSSYKSPPEAIILDIDDTGDPTHGAQQLSLFNGYHDEYCYMPLFIFEGVSGKLITSILRPGKRPTGRETRTIIKRVVLCIRTVWPSVGILIRGDSHFATPELYAWCDRHDVRYILGLSGNSRLKTLAHPALSAARKEHKNALKSGRTSCHRFMANCFRLMLHSAAYIILHIPREQALAGTDFAAAQFDAIRRRLLKVGAEVREMKTKLHFIPPSSFPLKHVFAAMHRNAVILA